MGWEELPRCGRPTKSGRPCGSILFGLHQIACNLHEAAGDDVISARLRKAYDDGYKAGQIRQEPCEICRQRIEDEREKKKLSRFRLVESGGQVVQCGRYAYVWHGAKPLAVDDRVLLPGNWLHKDPSEAVVTGFGTDYDGALSAVIRKVA